MPTFDVLVEVALRPGIADPQGATIERALPALGFDDVHDVRVGKAIRFAVEAADEASARGAVEELCKRFLANPVIEDVRIEVHPGSGRRNRRHGVDSSSQNAETGPR